MKNFRYISIVGVLLFSFGLVTVTLEGAKAASVNSILDTLPSQTPFTHQDSLIRPNNFVTDAPNAISSKLFAGTGKFVSDSGQNGDDYAFEIDVSTNISQELFTKRPVSGATFDPTTNTVLFTSSGPYADGSNFYSWSRETMTYTLLGPIQTITGELRIDGLAISNGTLYGDHGITDENGIAGLYEIDLNSLSATLVLTFTNQAVSGIEADPVTGKIYGVDDGRQALIEIGLDGTITETVAYPAGQIDIDGLAIDSNNTAYLITDEPGFIYVYNFQTATYGTLVAPWKSVDYFSAGAFILDPDITLNPTSIASTQFPDQIKYRNLTISNTGAANLTWTIQEDASSAGVCSSSTDIPWLSLGQSSGSNLPGTDTVVATSFNSTNVSAGVYTGTLCVTSNDPVIALVQIPLTMTVEANPYSVDLSPAQALSGSPGEVVTYTLTVTNTSPNAADTFALSTSGTWVASLSTPSVSLGSGASITFTVAVTIPNMASDGAQDVTTVTATSQTDAGATDSSQLTSSAVVSPVYSVDVSPAQALSGSPGEVVTYTLTVTNTSPNAADTFALSTSGTWVASLSTPSVSLGSGASITFTVAVTIPNMASDGAQDVTTVTATSQADAGATDSSQLTSSAVVSPVYSVDVSPAQALSGSPGEVVTYTLTVTNTSPNAADTFALSTSGTWVASLSTPSVSLGSGTSTTFTVAVTIPNMASDGAQDVTTVTATSQADAGATDSSQLTSSAVVSPVYSVDVSPAQALSGSPGEVVTYTLTVTNTSPNAADTFALSTSGTWVASLSTPSVSLGSGASITFTVAVTIPNMASDGAQDVTTVTATSQADAGATDSSQLTTTSAYPYHLYLPVVLKDD